MGEAIIILTFVLNGHLGLGKFTSMEACNKAQDMLIYEAAKDEDTTLTSQCFDTETMDYIK